MDTPTAHNRVAKVADLIGDIRIAFLTSVAPDGSLHSRPMATQRDRFDGSLWFFTRFDSAKVRETHATEHVSVTYAEPSSNTYVALSGHATTYQDRDKAEELWHPFMKTWFPQGLDDPQLAVMRVDIDHAEYWDAPSSSFVNLYGMAKATLTGKSPNPGDHQSFEMPATH